MAVYLPDLLRSNGFDISELEFEKPLKKRLTCPVCQSVLWKPRRLSCGHHVCKNCLDKVFQNNDSATCPVDVDDDCKNIKIDEVFVDHGIFREVRYLIVKCPNSKHECSAVMYMGQLTIHLFNCQDKIVSCKYNCGIKTMRKDLLSHYEICPKKPQKCKYKYVGCNFEGNPEKMEEHHKKFSKQHLKLVAVYTRTRDSDPSAQQQVHLREGCQDNIVHCSNSSMTASTTTSFYSKFRRFFQCKGDNRNGNSR